MPNSNLNDASPRVAGLEIHATMTVEFDKLHWALAVTAAELNETNEPPKRIALLRSLRILVDRADALLRETEVLEGVIQQHPG